MMRLLLSKLLPLGLTGAFLQSSFSPLKPALAAFRAANGALAGEASASPDADFEAMLDQQLKKGGGIPSAAAKPTPANAKDQLDAIIAQVKGQGGDAPTPAPAPSHGSKPSKAPARSASKAAPAPGKEIKLTSVGK